MKMDILHSTQHDKMPHYHGLYRFSITSEKNGKCIDIETLDSYEDHESYYDDTCWDLSDQIHKLLEEHLTKFNIKSQSWQVETYTRNGGPLIDYSIRCNCSPMDSFDFDITIEQSNGWIVNAYGSGDCDEKESDDEDEPPPPGDKNEFDEAD